MNLQAELPAYTRAPVEYMGEHNGTEAIGVSLKGYRGCRIDYVYMLKFCQINVPILVYSLNLSRRYVD